MISRLALLMLGVLGLLPEVARAEDRSTGGASEASSVTVSLRSWYLYDDMTFGSSNTDIADIGTGPFRVEYATSLEPFNISMFGASVSLAPSGWDGTVITLTAGFGESETKATTVGEAVVFRNGIDPLQGTASDVVQVRSALFKADIELERTDLELSAQRPLNDTVGLLFGIRREESKISYDQVFQFAAAGSPPPEFAVLPAGGSDDYTMYSARFGLTGSIPLTSDFRHSMSATGMGFVGYRDASVESYRYNSAWMFGPDVSVGYSFRLSERLSADLRYRALFFFSDGGNESIREPKSTHGLNLSLSYRFGR